MIHQDYYVDGRNQSFLPWPVNGSYQRSQKCFWLFVIAVVLSVCEGVLEVSSGEGIRANLCLILQGSIIDDSRRLMKYFWMFGIATVLYASGSVFAALSGGGTEADPYRIQSRADFNEYADPANAALYWTGGTYAKLMCDLNLSDTAYSQSPIAPDANSISDGFQGTNYTGVFDGNGHTISSLTIIASMKDYIGLFGYVGYSGQVKNLAIENAKITSHHYAGGLTGLNDGSLAACYVTGMVGGTYGVGGVVGCNGSGTIISCYAAGSVIGGSSVGGLVGVNGGSLSFCYATGSVSGNDSIGGLVGSNAGTVTASFWDKQTSGQAASDGGTGKTTAEMMMLSTFTSAEWDFSDSDGDAADWMMLRPGEDYPRLAWQPVIAGDIAGLYGVNMTDFMEIAYNWLEQDCPLGCEQADIDNDGRVDLVDFAILAAAIGGGTPVDPIKGIPVITSRTHKALWIGNYNRSNYTYQPESQCFREGILLERCSWKWFVQNLEYAKANYDLLIFETQLDAGRGGARLDHIDSAGITAQQLHNAIKSWNDAGKKVIFNQVSDSLSAETVDVAGIQTSVALTDVYTYSRSSFPYPGYSIQMKPGVDTAYFGGESPLDKFEFEMPGYTMPEGYSTGLEDTGGYTLTSPLNPSAVPIIEVTNGLTTLNRALYDPAHYCIIGFASASPVGYGWHWKSFKYLHHGIVGRRLIGNTSHVKLALDCLEGKKVAAYGIDCDGVTGSRLTITSFKLDTNGTKLMCNNNVSAPNKIYDNDEVYIQGTTNYNGKYTVVSAGNAYVVINKTYVAESPTSTCKVHRLLEDFPYDMTFAWQGWIEAFNGRKLEIGLVGERLPSSAIAWVNNRMDPQSTDYLPNVRWCSHTWDHYGRTVTTSETFTLTVSQVYKLQHPYYIKSLSVVNITDGDTYIYPQGTSSFSDTNLEASVKYWTTAVNAAKFAWNGADKLKFNSALIGKELTVTYTYLEDHEKEWAGSVEAMRDDGLNIAADSAVYLTGSPRALHPTDLLLAASNGIQFCDYTPYYDTRLGGLLKYTDDNENYYFEKLVPLEGSFFWALNPEVLLEGNYQTTPTKPLNALEMADLDDRLVAHYINNNMPFSHYGHDFTLGPWRTTSIYDDNYALLVSSTGISAVASDNSINTSVTNGFSSSEFAAGARIKISGFGDDRNNTYYMIQNKPTNQKIIVDGIVYDDDAGKTVVIGRVNDRSWTENGTLNKTDPNDAKKIRDKASAAIKAYLDAIDEGCNGAYWAYRGDYHRFIDYANQYLSYDAVVNSTTSETLYIRNRGDKVVGGLTFRVMKPSSNVLSVKWKISGTDWPDAPLQKKELNNQTLFYINLQPNQNITVELTYSD